MVEIKCDHAEENPKLHPACEYLSIGNKIIGMCGTCWGSIKAQVYESDNLLGRINNLERRINDNIKALHNATKGAQK